MNDGATKIVLEETTRERDLRVYVDQQLKFSQHCEKAVNSANRLLGLVRRSFESIDHQSLTYVFKGLIRPILEYGNCVWSPQYNKDKLLLENVQRRATKLVKQISELSYEERLIESLNLACQALPTGG